MPVEVVVVSVGFGLESAGAGLVADPKADGSRSRTTGVFDVNMDLGAGLKVARDRDFERGAPDIYGSERALLAVVVSVVLMVVIVVLARLVVVAFVALLAVVMPVVGGVS